MARKERPGDAEEPKSLRDRFDAIAETLTQALGTPWTMAAATLVVVVWALTGPIFGFSDTWQLVINTGTTVVTFLMVFVIQTSQNRQAKATQIKLDELIHATKGTRQDRMLAEKEPEEELEREERDYEREARAARRSPSNIRQRRSRSPRSARHRS